MKLYLKFLLSIVQLPFLLPWFLADKTFEYVFQPSIFRRHNIPVSRAKIWLVNTLKILGLVLFASFLITRVVGWFESYNDFLARIHDLKILFWIFLLFGIASNIFVGMVNFVLFQPILRLIYYLGGAPLRFWDFTLAFYICAVLAIFAVNLGYRLITTYRSINRAVELRNKAVRDVDIIHFTKLAKPDQVFLGLDMNREGLPLYAQRNWLKGHLQVIGAPGTGKTESIIHPIWFQELRRNVATISIDGSGSRRKIDRIYTIASSMAQAQDIYYFNPADPERSFTYNPLLRGSASDVKRKIMASVNWGEHSPETRKLLDYVLNVFLQAMEETRTHFHFKELLNYFQSPEHLRGVLPRLNDPFVKNGAQKILEKFAPVQSGLGFFIGILRELNKPDYARLLNTDQPEIEIVGIYYGRRDCYFTLPIQSDEPAIQFLGRLILQDIRYAFQHISTRPGDSDAQEGLLIIDETAKFISPHFIELLQASRAAGVCVCYTNQSLTEMDNPALNLTPAFKNQLAEQTNMVCCFQLGGQDSVQMMAERFGLAAAGNPGGDGAGTKDQKLADPEFLKRLDIGRCVLFVRQPRVLTVLKTGYFKLEKPLRFKEHREGVGEADLVKSA